MLIARHTDRSSGKPSPSPPLKGWEESRVYAVTPGPSRLDSYTTQKGQRQDKRERSESGREECLSLENSSLLNLTSWKNVFFDSTRAFVHLG